MNLETYERTYPWREMEIEGKPFRYRISERRKENDRPEKTIVLLTGAVGLSDLMYKLFDELSEDFSVIIFDYPEDLPTADELCRALDALLKKLDRRVYLVGQSLGGLLAQIMAAHDPDQIEGLILINTGTLALMMGPQAWEDMTELTVLTRQAETLMRALPFDLTKNILAGVIGLKSGNQDPRIKEFTNVLRDKLTRSYAFHMMELLLSTEDEFGLRASEFERYRGRVLLILSGDDHTFSRACQAALIASMPDAEVRTDLLGGHMALFKSPEKMARVIRDFILERGN